MRAEVEGGLFDDLGTPTTNSPWLSLNDGPNAVTLDEPRMLQRPKVSTLGMRDESDLTTYGYALRVAYINNILRNNHRAVSSGAASPLSPTLQTPNIAQSPGSPSSYFSLPRSPGETTPLALSPVETPHRKSTLFGRRKSISNLKAKETSDGHADGAKLPREVLSGGFWDVLGNEGGDSMWRTTVNTFLSHLPNKKATKTNSGTNLRYIPSLIDAFSNAYLSASSLTPALRRGTTTFSISLPNTADTSPTRPAGNGGDSKAVHVVHFIALLQQAIMSHYSPLNKKMDDKERDQLSKLRIELDFWASLQEGGGRTGRVSSSDERMSRLSLNTSTFPPASPSPSIPPVPALPSAYLGSPQSTKAPASPPYGIFTPEMSRVVSQSSTTTGSGKSTSSVGFGETTSVDLVDVVRRVWGIEGSRLRSDLDGLKRAGLDEKTYLSDLKQHLTNLRADPRSASSGAMQDRIGALQDEISNLMHARPDLAGLTLTSRSSIYTVSSDSDSTGNGTGLFFTPHNDKDKVYQRLAERIYLLLDHETSFSATSDERQLLELCGSVWGLSDKTSVQLDAVVNIWSESILATQADDERVGAVRGRLDRESLRALGAKQDGWGLRVVEAIKGLDSDIAGTLDDDNRHSQIESLARISAFLLEETNKAISTLFPITAIPPLTPPPSIPHVAHTLFRSKTLLSVLPSASRTAWQDAADELRAIAVSEYATQAMSMIQSNGDVLTSQEQTEDGLKGYEEMADWIACGVERAMKAWRRSVGGLLNPPAIILSRQLPLFLAELQAFDQPQEGRKADVIFGLYEKTARLLSLWEDVCPETECGFELDVFFEPHVREWLKSVEEVDTHEWVSRAVGMDSWVPEGNLRHSQSVLDLFDFIRRACQTVLHELPLQPYKRACYLIDLSRTSSAAITQYASTVQSLFKAELLHGDPSTPTTEAAPVVNTKTSAWLVKSKQAVKSFERKRTEAFNIPPTACVKITDMIAAKQCTEDLGYALDAAETSRIVKEHHLTNKVPHTGNAKYEFHIVIGRGENLYGKNLSNPADAFVTVFESGTPTRIHKTKTIMSQIDPTWEEDLQHGVSSATNLEISCYDRSLVGKNELIGSATLKLDPLVYRETPLQDIALPLSPRGTVHLRVELETGDRHEVNYQLNAAKRMLDRVANDMIRSLIDKMSEYIKLQLSMARAREILKPLLAKPKKGVPKVTAISNEEYEESLSPLFDYFDTCFSTFNVTFPEQLRVDVMTAVWKRVVDILLSLLIPPLSDKESHTEPPTPQEVTVVFQWLKLLKSFFNAADDGHEHGVPAAALQAAGYRDILLVGQYLDLPTPTLKEKCTAAIKGVGRSSSGPRIARPKFSPTSSNFNVRAQAGSNEEERSAELLLRVLRMRPQTQEFLTQYVTQLNAARAVKNSR